MIECFNITCEKCTKDMKIVPVYTTKDIINREIEAVFKCSKCGIEIIFNATIPQSEIKEDLWLKPKEAKKQKWLS